MRRFATSALAVLLMGTIGPMSATAGPPTHPIGPFITSARPYLISTDPGTTITPILTSGEVIDGT